MTLEFNIGDKGKAAKVIMHHGAFGPSPLDDQLDVLLRKVAVAYGDKDDWPEKYGAQHDDDRFMMHTECWCEKKGCPWCSGDAPNFLYKPTGLAVRWYKYIGRSRETNRAVTEEDLAGIATLLPNEAVRGAP